MGHFILIIYCKKIPQLRDFLINLIYFFVFFFFMVVFLAAGFAVSDFTVAETVFLLENASRNARYRPAPQMYTTNALNAVSNPGIRPSEKYAKNITATIRTIVYPKFLPKTFIIFSKVFIFNSFRLDGHNYITFCIKNPQKTVAKSQPLTGETVYIL